MICFQLKSCSKALIQLVPNTFWGVLIATQFVLVVKAALMLPHITESLFTSQFLSLLVTGFLSGASFSATIATFYLLGSIFFRSIEHSLRKLLEPTINFWAEQPFIRDVLSVSIPERDL